MSFSELLFLHFFDSAPYFENLGVAMHKYKCSNHLAELVYDSIIGQRPSPCGDLHGLHEIPLLRQVLHASNLALFLENLSANELYFRSKIKQQLSNQFELVHLVQPILTTLSRPLTSLALLADVAVGADSFSEDSVLW